MAIFEIEADGKTFEVDAPDMDTAMKALGLGSPAAAPAAEPAAAVSGQKKQAELRNYVPTLRDQAAMGIDKVLGLVMGGEDKQSSGMRQRIAQGIVGYKGIGFTNPSIADFSPAAPVFGGQEMMRAAEKGNWGEAALDALSVLPATGAPVASTVRTFAPRGFGFGMGVTEASREAAASGKVADAARKDFAAATGRPVEQISPQDLEHSARAAINTGSNGQDVRLMDVGGEATGRELRRATNVSPQGHQAAAAVIQPRFEGQTDRAIDFLRTAYNNPQDATRTIADLRQQGRAANNVNYTAAWTRGGRPVFVSEPGLDQLMNNPIMQEFERDAARRFEASRVAGNNQGVPLENPANPRQRSLMYWDQVKRSLDDGIDGASPEMAMHLRSIRERMMQYLDNGRPEYVRARGVAAQFFGERDAVEAGQAVVRGHWTPAEIAQQVARMGQAERAQFQGGFLSDYLTEISFTRDRRNLVDALMNSPGERAKVEAVLGPQGADNFRTFLDVEAAMDGARQAMGNSTTTRQALDVARGGGGVTLPNVAGIAATGALMAIGNVKTAAATALLMAARHAQTRLSEDVARRVVSQLLSDNPRMYAEGMREVYRSEPLRSSFNAMAQMGAQAVRSEGASGDPPQVRKIEDALRLPKGTTFRDPHGDVRRR
jgi:hypothetical protein